MGMGVGALAAAAAAAPQAVAAAEGGATPKRAGPTNKVAVISGFSSGIGYATAIALAERGVNVIGSYRRNEAGARQLVEEAGRFGVKVVPFHLDLNEMSSIAGFHDNVVKTLQSEWKTDRFDYLVNNAGFGQDAPFEKTTEALFDEFTRVILKGHFFLTQAFLPNLKDGGAIVNVTSNSALPTGLAPGYSAYASMKGGLMVLSRYMAKELSPRKIRVNSVAPGPTRTRIANDAFAKYPQVIPPLVAQTALGRLGESRDLGLVIAALLSDEFGWVTGENIEASGGFKL
jgi:NAD(P)-dependent dehydrogenase (short-subunit alcohol dehydrogenase family)